jgi:hypothetical protein
MFIMQAYQTSQYGVPRGGIFLGKWPSSFAGSSDGKMNVQSACALNTRYMLHGQYTIWFLWQVPQAHTIITEPYSVNGIGYSASVVMVIMTVIGKDVTAIVSISLDRRRQITKILK